PLADRYPFVSNPLGIANAAAIFDLFDHASFIAALLISVTAVVVRFRGARGVERQQLKWFTYAVVVLVLTFLVDQLIQQATQPWSQLVQSILTDLAITFVVAAIGIAVLRYRLYDIDLIINRTLVYGVLTGTLALVYFGSVVLLQTLL